MGRNGDNLWQVQGGSSQQLIPHQATSEGRLV